MLAQIKTIAKFTIIESLRNRVLWMAVLIVAISFGLVEFIGDLTITEHRVTQVAILAAFLRLSAVVIITLFVVTSALRELQDKTLEMMLAMPLRRSSYYLGKLAGFSLIALMIAVIFSLLLLLYAPAEQVGIWSLSLFMELMLVLTLGLAMLFTFNQVPAALAAVFIVYAASRTVSSIYLMAKYPLIQNTSLAQRFMDGFIEALTWLLPGLHHYTQTEWLAYSSGHWSLLIPILGQTVIYMALLSGIALFDFYRKNF